MKCGRKRIIELKAKYYFSCCNLNAKIGKNNQGKKHTSTKVSRTELANKEF